MTLQKRSNTANITTAFLILALFTVTIVGGVSFLRAREALKDAVFGQLSVAASLKQQEIERWFEERERDFLVLIQSPDAQKHFKTILQSKEGSAEYKAAYRQLIYYFGKVAALKPSFKQIALLNRSNRIILSTDRLLIDKHIITTNLTYFEGIESGDAFNPVLYRSPITNKPAITFAAPVRDLRGQRQGVILADLNFEGIVQVVGKRAGLGETGETYLVGSLVNQNTFISREQLDLPTGPQQLHSQGIDQAMQGKSGAGLYRNYAGVPILGVYRWLNNQNLALFAEISQAEAFAPARQLATSIIFVGLISTAGFFMGVRWLARQLKISQEKLETYSQQLEKKAQEAETASRTKSEFLANMSHELRTPLNAILGFTQIMARDTTVTATQLQQLSIISRSGEHLLELINDVLSMAKIEAGRTTLSASSFDLYHLLDALQEMLQVKAQGKGLLLVVERSPHVPHYIQTDEAKLRQVLINLLGNAIKFTDAGRVTLTVQKASAPPDEVFEATVDDPSNPPRPTEWIDFEVEDTGPGISEAELAYLFDPFFQAAKTPKSHQGTGLGLAISQEFVNLMGGEITVRQTSSRGSTFGFTIQVMPVIPVKVQPKSPCRRVLHLAPDQPSYRILIVEDSWENRRLLVELLTTVGFEIKEAENGQAGLNLWSTWHPHLIWMDMRMPLLDGYEATRYIRKQEAGQSKQGTLTQPTKIIALTASVFEEERAAILAAGCDDLVCKPLQDEIIFEKMANLLGVTYLHEEEPGGLAANALPKPMLRSDAFKDMSRDWIASLHEAALQVDGDVVLELIAQIPSSQAVLAEQLQQLTQTYCFDEIMDLTQSYLED